jgi:hypothetical protein
MKCPRCDLVNPATAQRCDCGYDFASKQLKESYLAPRERKKQSSRKPFWWAGFAAAGFVQVAYAVTEADQSHRVIVTAAAVGIVVLLVELISRKSKSPE